MALQYGDGGGIAAGRVGIGANFAKSRLLLAKRAGYLPQGFQMQPDKAPEQWRSVSSNLARDARAAGFSNPMLYLRTGATRGGKIPKATAYRPGAGNDPSGALAYANSRIAQLQRAAPQMGGNVQQAVGRALAAPGVGADPRALWRTLSGVLAAQAQGAGYADPRRYLAAMGAQPRVGLAAAAPMNQRQMESFAPPLPSGYTPSMIPPQFMPNRGGRGGGRMAVL